MAKSAAKSKPPTPAASPDAVSELTRYGEIALVRFGDLRSNDNVRRIRDEAEQEEIGGSVKAAGSTVRIEGYRNKDGTITVESGSRRHLALAASGYPPDRQIEVILHPPPAHDAEQAARGMRYNIQAAMAWPDKVLQIGIMIGTCDKAGNLRSDAAVKAGLAKGIFYTRKEAASILGLRENNLDTYARASLAPYPDLVKMHSIGGTLAHGDTYAKYPDKEKSAILDYYLKNGRTFPVPAPRLKAEGAGRPAKGAIKGQKKKPEPLRVGGTVWSKGSEGAASSPAAPPAPLGPAVGASPLEARQQSMFDVSPAPAPAPIAGAGATQEEMVAVDEETRINDLCDHFGVSPEAVALFDAIRIHWPVPGAAWTEDQTMACEQAIRHYLETDWTPAEI